MSRGLTIRQALDLGNQNIGNEGRYNKKIFNKNPDLAILPAKFYFAEFQLIIIKDINLVLLLKLHSRDFQKNSKSFALSGL